MKFPQQHQEYFVKITIFKNTAILENGLLFSDIHQMGIL